MIDIRLDNNFELTPATDGDAPLCTNYACTLQEIKLAAMTQEGELFFDEDFGWSLLDFMQTTNDELIKLEITERIKNKLVKTEEIEANSIRISVYPSHEVFKIFVRFKFVNAENFQSIDIKIDKVEVRVII